MSPSKSDQSWLAQRAERYRLRGIEQHVRSESKSPISVDPIARIRFNVFAYRHERYRDREREYWLAYHDRVEEALADVLVDQVVDQVFLQVEFAETRRTVLHI